MPQFEKVSSKVDGNAAKKVDKSPNDPLPHGLERDVKLWHAIEIWLKLLLSCSGWNKYKQASEVLEQNHITY